MSRYKSIERTRLLQNTRLKLLAEATKEFARAGYSGANINRISEQAGYAKGTIYNYFPSKQALMLALIDHIAVEHIAYVSEQVRSDTDPSTRLYRFYQAGFAYVESHRDEARILITSLYGPDRDFNEHLYLNYQPMFQLVSRDIITPGIEQAIFRKVDPASTATLLMTIYLGTSSNVDEQGKTYMDPDQVADFVYQALRREG
jgi:AcrR family transcriptional regulator